MKNSLQYVVDGISFRTEEGKYEAEYGVTGTTNQYIDDGQSSGPTLVNSWRNIGLVGFRQQPSRSIRTYHFINPKTREKFSEDYGVQKYGHCPLLLKEDTLIRMSKVYKNERCLEYYQYDNQEMARVTGGSEYSKYICHSKHINSAKRELVAFNTITSKSLKELLNKEQFIKEMDIHTSPWFIKNRLENKRNIYIVPDLMVITLLVFMLNQNEIFGLPMFALIPIIAIAELFNYCLRWSLSIRTFIFQDAFVKQIQNDFIEETLNKVLIRIHNEGEKNIYLSHIIECFSGYHSRAEEFSYESNDEDFKNWLHLHTTLSLSEINTFMSEVYKED